MSKKKADVVWEELFEEYHILDEIKNNGYFIIKASQIKKVYEPRLVTKFDHSINLPKIFKKHKISILPISRGEYILSNHRMFFDFEEISNEIEQINFPAYIESVDKDVITSETVALNSSYISGMLQDFIEDENIFPTVSGRMGSGKFSFNIINDIDGKESKVDVANSQIEIDGAYEGDKYLTLVEAKQHISNDFLIRQIYFPYRVWKDKVSKEVKIVYFVYSNGIFTLYEYKFEDPNNYNSLKLIKQKKYTYEDIQINVETIQNIINTVTIVEEPEIPFPQADDFRKVINLCELAKNEDLTKEFIASEYEFNIRQSDYYTNACRYLGLMKKERSDGITYYRLTDEGESMLKSSYIERQLFLVNRILEHKIFHDVLQENFETGYSMTTNEIEDKMMSYDLYHVGMKTDVSSTYHRRASSIRGWILWILSIIEE